MLTETIARGYARTCAGEPSAWNAMPATTKVAAKGRKAPSPHSPPGHFGALDGLRGVAAFTVLIGHATSVLMGHSIVPSKVMAVHFFFCLSGFVMGYAYEGRLRGGMSVRDFMVARMIRLYPLLMLGGALGGAAFLLCEPRFALGGRGSVAVVAGVFALPSPKLAFSVGYWPMNPPEWSLFMEMAAYVGFALTVRHASTRRLVAVIALAALAYAFELHRRPGTEAIYDRFLGMIPAFGMGLLVWRAQSVARLRALRLPAPMLPPLSALVIVGACMTPDRWALPATLGCILIAFPAVVHAGAQHVGGGRAARWLGDISYPLYILHWPVLIVAKAIAGDGAPGWIAVFATCGVATSLAYAALRLFDMPLRRAIALAMRDRRHVRRAEVSFTALVGAGGVQ